MSVNIRYPRGLINSKISDYPFVVRAFDAAHALHLRLSEAQGLDVYRESVTNITDTEFKLSVIVQKFPNLLDTVNVFLQRFLGKKQEPFYLKLAEQESESVGVLYGIESSQSSKMVVLDNMIALDGHDGSAIHLVKDFTRWASARGYETMREDVLCNNEWSLALAEELELTPAKVILAKNLDLGTDMPAVEDDRTFETGLVSAFVKRQSARSWYKHHTLSLRFNDQAGALDDTGALSLSGDVQKAMAFGGEQGCGFVETEISIEDEALSCFLQEKESFKPFKFVFERPIHV